MFKIIRLSLLISAFAAVPGMAAAHDAAAHESAGELSVKTAEVGTALRDLWVGHIFWVRNVVVATLADNPTAVAASEEQVVANAQAIAGAIEPFYGAEAKEALFTLLAGHYGAVKGYLDATVANDSTAQNAAIESMTANAEEIAVFLSNANPNLPKDDVFGLLAAHGGHHVVQIEELQAGDYESEARTWEDMKAHMYVVADALTNALAVQFADQF
jgi:hypothetical protein